MNNAQHACIENIINSSQKLESIVNLPSGDQRKGKGLSS